MLPLFKEKCKLSVGCLYHVSLPSLSAIPACTKTKPSCSVLPISFVSSRRSYPGFWLHVRPSSPFAGVHERLLQCMLRVEIIGCVAHFLHDVVGTDDAFCRWKDDGEEERRSLLRATSAEEGQDTRNVGSSPRGKGQSLVVHMRSGDIFSPELSDIPWYGQVSKALEALIFACPSCHMRWKNVFCFSNNLSLTNCIFPSPSWRQSETILRHAPFFAQPR